MSILTACGVQKIGGMALDADLQASNMNFYKATEGFLESLPQAIVQLSYVLRSAETPSKLIMPVDYNQEYSIPDHYILTLLFFIFRSHTKVILMSFCFYSLNDFIIIYASSAYRIQIL